MYFLELTPLSLGSFLKYSSNDAEWSQPGFNQFYMRSSFIEGLTVSCA